MNNTTTHTFTVDGKRTYDANTLLRYFDSTGTTPSERLAELRATRAKPQYSADECMKTFKEKK